METQKTIELLAEKLGTTAKYLWSVLINQAPIYAMTTIFEIVVTFLSGYVLYRVHEHLVKKDLYYEYEEAAIIPMVILFIIWVVFALIAFFTISNVVYAIFNPEYWALKQVLNAM